MDMIAVNSSTDPNFSHASNPFREYRSKLTEMATLISTKEDAQAQAEGIEQVYTSFALLGLRIVFSKNRGR